MTPRPAGYWIRAGAYIIDGFILASVQWLAQGALILGGVGGAAGLLLPAFAGLGFSIAYFTWLPVAWNGQTVGKLAAGIAVRRMDGKPLTYGRALLRWVGYIVSSLPCGLGFMLPIATSDKRALHDFVADTRVVHVREVGALRKAAVISAPFLLTILSGLLGVWLVAKSPQFQAVRAHAEETLEKDGKDFVRRGRRAMKEGELLGAGGTDEECLAAAVKRLKECSTFACQVNHKLFLSYCLMPSQRREGFCDGVPDPGSILSSVTWSLKRCARLGVGDAQACGRMLRAVQEHCHRPPPPPSASGA